jgi:eukaryotic-like serine/threonine-protein kinase
VPAAWSWDSRYVFFNTLNSQQLRRVNIEGGPLASNRSGQPLMYIKPTDGSSEERLITDVPGVPTSWSGDGRFLLFTRTSPNTATDLWAMRDPRIASEASKPFPVVATQFSEQAGQFSPDGRWIAYMSSESSVIDVYVRPFSPDDPAAGGRWLVSAGLSGLPRWGADGRRLFYVSIATFGVTAVDVDAREGFRPGRAQRLFTAPPPLLPVGWSMAHDGRFLFVTTPTGGRTAPFTVVMNWAATLRK